MAQSSREAPPRREAIQRERVRLLFERSNVAQLANVLVAGLVIYSVWPMVGHGALLVWLGAVTLVSAAREWLTQRFARREEDASPHRWGTLFAIGAFVNGCVWGSMPFWMFPSISTASQLLLTLVASGMAAGSAALSASHPPTFYLFTLPLCAPVAVFMLLQPTRLQHAAALAMMAFVGFLTVMTRLGYRAIAGALDAELELREVNRTLEERVCERTAALSAALHARDEFLTIAAHELRTPLTSLKLQLQLIRRHPTPSSLGRLAVVERQADRLSTLINTLLDVSRMSEGQLTMRPEPTDLAQVVQRIATELEGDLAQRHCELRLRLPGTQVIGEWDPVYVGQIVTNLLTNAAKYGAGHPIDVSLEPAPNSATRVVHDEGIGIPEEAIGRIFGKFERASPGLGYGGLGLGLFIVRRLVQEMRGQVEVASRVGAGTTFAVTLPRRRR